MEAAVRAAEALEETKGLMARRVVIASPHPDYAQSNRLIDKCGKMPHNKRDMESL